MKKYAIGMIATLFATAACATDFVWTGKSTAVDKTWADAANWEVNGSPADTYPQAGDTATFNTAATPVRNEEASVGTLVLNADVTLRFDKWLTVGAIQGTGEIILTNRGRLRNISGTELTCANNIRINDADGHDWDKRGAMPWIMANGATFNISGKLLGNANGDVFFTMSGYNGVVLKGDNSEFLGTIHLDSNGSNRAKFGTTGAGIENGRYVIHGNASDNGGLPEEADGGTLKIGSIYTDWHNTGNYPFRFKNLTSTAVLEIGSLNREDDRISIRMGEGNTSTGQAKIRKVGTGTLELWHTGHIRGTEIADGTLLVTSADALNGKTDGSTAVNGDCTVSFTGGTLKYGTDEWTDSSNPAGVTTDWSALVKNSTDYIKVDTGTNDVTWSSTSLQSNNPDAKGFTKKGEGTLTLSGSDNDNTRPFFVNAAYTNRIEGGTLAIKNSKFNTKPDMQSKYLGTGTLNIYSSEASGGFRLKQNGAFEEFEGTIDWSSTNSQPSAVGFMMNGNGQPNISWPNVRFRVTGNPDEATSVMACEVTAGRSITVAAFDHLYPNAQIYMNNNWSLNINGTKGDSYLNGVFNGDKKVTITKTGAGKLTIGPGFSAPDGSAVNVNEGVFAMDAGMTAADLTAKSVTIANGVALTGEGVFGAVDLSVNDVVVPDAATFTDKTKTYPLLTATSFSGKSENVESLLGTLNANETKGHWKLRRVSNGNGTATISIAYAKNAFVVILR